MAAIVNIIKFVILIASLVSSMDAIKKLIKFAWSLWLKLQLVISQRPIKAGFRFNH